MGTNILSHRLVLQIDYLEMEAQRLQQENSSLKKMLKEAGIL